MTNSYIHDLIQRRNRALNAFSTIGDLRPGSLAENYRKCGKPNCHCAEEGGKKHGPSYVLTISVGGKQKSIRIKPDQLEQVREQVEEYKRFREISREFLEVSEKLSCALQEMGDEDQKKL